MAVPGDQTNRSQAGATNPVETVFAYLDKAAVFSDVLAPLSARKEGGIGDATQKT